ncbi:MAG TPA: metallophosphoesterase [Sphingobacteriaceae bacterium]
MNLRTSFNFFKWIFTLSIFLITFGCKTTSYTSSPSYGVEKGDDYFSIAVLPDTQYYTVLRNGGTMEMFYDQIQWIRDNRKKENIEYVIHLGDITDHDTPVEWERAKSALYRLDDDHIPYGLAVGNHDETPNGYPSEGSPGTNYTKYFGRSHFKERSWFGGAMGSTENIDNHFDLFTAKGIKFIALYFVFNEPSYKGYNPRYEKQVMAWADSVLTANSDRKAILVTHSMLGRPKGSNCDTTPGQGNRDVQANFTKQGQIIYDMAKHHDNVFLMLGGHVGGEGFRKDNYNGNIIKTYLTDYQFRQNAPYGGIKDRNGGNGTMRLMKFNKTKQSISVTTFAPRANGQLIKEEDEDSQFTEPMFK